MKTYKDFLTDLGKRESGNKYDIENKWGFLGRWQFGKPRLWDLGISIDGYKPKGGEAKKVISKKYFLEHSELQDAVMDLHIKDIMKQLIKKYSFYLNTTVLGIKITDSGCVAGVHLKGWGGLKDFLINKKDNSDALGTKISEYISKFGGYNLTYTIDEKTLINEIAELAIPKTELDRPKSKFKLINQTKGVTMLPINDLEEAALAVCDIVNDVYNKAGVMGFLDNLPGLIAAYEGKENILPQAADVDPVELAALQAKIVAQLQLPETNEAIASKAINAIWSIGELWKSIEAAKAVKLP